MVKTSDELSWVNKTLCRIPIDAHEFLNFRKLGNAIREVDPIIATAIRRS